MPRGLEDRARPCLWIPRFEALEPLKRSEDPLAAGARVWAHAEPWIEPMARLAQDPAVLLAEFVDWARLLDRHSTVLLEEKGGDTIVTWTNQSDVEPHRAECEFRQGAIGALLELCAGGELVSVGHVECAASGGEACRFVVDDWVPCRDASHARAFQETAMMATTVEGTERLSRRLEEMGQVSAFPDSAGLVRIRQFLEELEDIVLIFDRDLWLLDGNGAALRFSGISADELRGLSAQDLMSVASYRAVKASMPMLMEVGAMRGMQIEARKRDGWATLEVSARVSESKRTIVCIARDITARLRMEREIAERNQQLRAQNERIADADRLKSEFLANVSHELTTPLTCIKGFAKLLRRDFAAEDQPGAQRLAPAQKAEFLDIVGRESDRMASMIEGLLELSNIESGGVALDRVDVSLNSIAAECIQLLKPRLEEAGLEVPIVLDPDLPHARLDPDRMKQVVLNLVENAIKFSPGGSRMELRTLYGEACIQLRVANPTRELEPGDLERIFARFVQRDGSYTRKQGGVGLGLNLVRAIIGLHGGKVWAELPDRDQVEFIAELPLLD